MPIRSSVRSTCQYHIACNLLYAQNRVGAILLETKREHNAYGLHNRFANTHRIESFYDAYLYFIRNKSYEPRPRS